MTFLRLGAYDKKGGLQHKEHIPMLRLCPLSYAPAGLCCVMPWNKLRVFHSDCVRRMCRATRHMQWRHHLSNKQLRSRLHLEEIEVYVYKRQLAWLGDVSRMSWDRTPRKLLSAWVAAPRPVGAPQYSYGKGMLAALAYAGIDTDTKTVSTNWPAMAIDKKTWNIMVEHLGDIHAQLPPQRRGASQAHSSPLRAKASPYRHGSDDSPSSSDGGFIRNSSSSSSESNCSSSEAELEGSDNDSGGSVSDTDIRTVLRRTRSTRARAPVDYTTDNTRVRGRTLFQ
jgi:hypothetical protein